TLAGPNTFDGAINVGQGVLSVTNSSGLGTTAGGTFVQSGAAVNVSNNVSLAENFVIRDLGVGLDPTTMGAIRSTGGNNTLSGTITLALNTGFGVDAGTLTVSGQIMMAPSA